MVIEKLIVNFMLSLYNMREGSLKVISTLLSRTMGLDSIFGEGQHLLAPPFGRFSVMVG